MVRNVKSKYKFLMYPRFIQIFLNKYQLLPHKNILKTPTLSRKVFSNMSTICNGYKGSEAPLFLSMIVPPAEGEGSRTQVQSHDTPRSVPSSSQPHVTKTFTRRIRKESVVPQVRYPTEPNVADEPVSDTMVRAASTVTGLEGGQVSGNIHKNQHMATPTDSVSHEPESADINPMPQDTMDDVPHDTVVDMPHDTMADMPHDTMGDMPHDTVIDMVHG